MNSNNTNQVSLLSFSIVIFLITIVFEVNTNSNAQTRINTLDGLFTPTKAQRYFEEGRRNFKVQVEILDDPDYYFNEQIPQFDEELLEKTGETNPLPETNSNREIPNTEK